MTKAYCRFVSLLFVLFLGGLMVWHVLLPDRARSQVENRTLAQWPSFSWKTLTDGSFTAGVEDYFADQFPLRDSWTGVKARTEQLLGKTEFHGVYLCGDTLISKVEPPDEALLEQNLRSVRTLADAVDCPVYLGLIPSAAEIWRDKLPQGAESWEQTRCMEAAEDFDLPQLPIYEALQAHADEPIFYRTDHHWTTLGAFYGANAILTQLGREPLAQSGFTPETVSETFCGTLYSTSGIHWLPPDSIQTWAPDTGLTVTSWRDGTPQTAPLYETKYLAEKDQYSMFLGGNQPLCVIQNRNCPDGGKLLLIRDSYSDALAPFLAQSFSEVHLMDLRYNRTSAAQYAAEHGIDQIAVLYSIPNLLTDRNLVLLTR